MRVAIVGKINMTNVLVCASYMSFKWYEELSWTVTASLALCREYVVRKSSNRCWCGAPGLQGTGSNASADAQEKALWKFVDNEVPKKLSASVREAGSERHHVLEDYRSFLKRATKAHYLGEEQKNVRISCNNMGARSLIQGNTTRKVSIVSNGTIKAALR
ncbi:hypothetical protein EJ07DRAFT_157461 [Lizonia empirigonia]|nr:hypothetical protein EJ07DRAFT_157461 [Lizonia empirigonia]